MRKFIKHLKRLYFDCSSVNIKKDLKKIRKNIIVSREKPYKNYVILKEEIKKYFINNEKVLANHEEELEYMYNSIYKSSSKYNYNYALPVISVVCGIASGLCYDLFIIISDIDQTIFDLAIEKQVQNQLLVNFIRFIVFISIVVLLSISIVCFFKFICQIISFADSKRQEEIVDYKLEVINEILNNNFNAKYTNNVNNDIVNNNVVCKNIFLQLDIQLSNLANYYPYDQSAESDELAKKAIDEFYDSMVEKDMIDQNVLVDRENNISNLKSNRNNISLNKLNLFSMFIPAIFAAGAEAIGINNIIFLNLTFEFWAVLLSIILVAIIQNNINKKSSSRTSIIHIKRNKYYDYELSKISEKINALKNQISA